MNQTPNYQLNQWEATDRVQRTDFNADNAKIDAAIKAEADARSAQVSVLNAALNQKENCRIWTATYTGNGQSGQAHPNSLSFPGQPLIVFLISNGNAHTVLAPHQTGHGNFYITWSGNSVSWYSYADSTEQFNENGRTYRVVALLNA